MRALRTPLTARTSSRPATRGLAVIFLKPAGQHELSLLLDGRVGRSFDRERVAELSDVFSRVSAADAKKLIETFLPGFSEDETAALIRAVSEFERHARADADHEHLRTWPDTIRVPL